MKTSALKGALCALAITALGGYVATKRTARGARALHVLRGRPIAYRITVEEGVMTVRDDHTRIERCHFVGGTTAISVRNA